MEADEAGNDGEAQRYEGSGPDGSPIGVRTLETTRHFRRLTGAAFCLLGTLSSFAALRFAVVIDGRSLKNLHRAHDRSLGSAVHPKILPRPSVRADDFSGTRPLARMH